MATPAFKYRTYPLWIDQSYRPYRDEVIRVLDLMTSTYIGRKVLSFLYKGVLIMPYKPTPKDPVNAYADALDYKKAYMAGHALMTSIEIPGFGVIQVPTADFGTGAGSQVIVKYHPATWHELNKRMRGVQPGSGPAEVLFHELVHAQRMTNGSFLRHSVIENMHMDDFEEFCAIVAANIYRSERGFKLVRADHWGNKATDASLTDPAAYYQFYKAQFEKWNNTQPNFFRALAESPAPFNPIRVAVYAQGGAVYTPMALGPR